MENSDLDKNVKLDLPDLLKFAREDQIANIGEENQWISQKTFWIILDYVLNDDRENFKLIIQHSPELETLLNSITKIKLANLIKEVIIFNNSKFSLEKIEQIEKFINGTFNIGSVPADITIDRGFRELFLTEIKWDINENVISLIKQFRDENREYLENQFLESIDLGIDFGFWSILDLSDLMEMITRPEIIGGKLIDKKQFMPIVDAIEEVFVQQLLEYETVFFRKAALTFIFIDSYIHQGEETLTSAQELIDNLWLELKSENELFFNSTKYVFLAFYSKVINEYFKKSVDFIIRRNLIGSIISKFEEDITKENNTLREIFVNRSIHPWVFDKLVQGFHSYCDMLFTHIREIPPSPDTNKLINLVENAIELIHEIVIGHLCYQYDLTHPKTSVDDFIHEIQNVGIKNWYNVNIFNMIASASKILLFLNKERIYDQEYQERIDLWLKSLKITGEVETQFLHELDILLLTGKYPFDAIYQLIEIELEPDDAIYVSATFEERIVNVISKILEYLTNRFEKSDYVDEEAYEILLYFVSEWLQYFAQEDKYFNDANGVLSAIAIICKAQLIKSYFKKKQVELAFLMYINLFFFTEYITHKTYTIHFDTPSSGQKTEEQKITEKFHEMVGNLDFDNFLDLDTISNSAKNIEISIKRSYGKNIKNTGSTFSGMLSDELVFQYLDMIDALKEFLFEKINTMKGKELMKMGDLSLYTVPEPESVSRLSRIGSISSEKEIKEMPFPLVRNLHQMAVGMTVIPFDVGTDILNQTTLISSIMDLLQMRDEA